MVLLLFSLRPRGVLHRPAFGILLTMFTFWTFALCNFWYCFPLVAPFEVLHLPTFVFFSFQGLRNV